MFQQLEWQTATKISGFFSRLVVKQRKKPSATAVEQTEEDQTLTDGEEEEWEREEGLALMRQSVYHDINLCHPLQYSGEDLCSLHRRGKLRSKFKIKELEDICQHFDLSVEGPKNRKVSFVSAISVLVQSCSCSKKACVMIGRGLLF